MADMSIQKRRSGTMSGAEKITGVKNAQSEMLLARRLNQYQIKLRKNNLNTSLEEYRLENEARMLKLDSKTHDLEYKRRLFPLSDLSHEEMCIDNLQKYLGRNKSSQCYLDKRMGYEVRNRSAPDYIPAVVSQARMVLRRKQLLKDLEDARRGMYSFMRSRSELSDRVEGDQTFLTEMVQDSDDEEDQLDKAVKKSQGLFPSISSVPAVRPSTMHQPQKSIKEKLKANPITREAFENHRIQKQLAEEEQRMESPSPILARMSIKKPLTKTDMMEEVAEVNENVEEFNKKMNDIVWANKQEEFEQGLKFIKDKDTEWAKFRDQMNMRMRATTAGGGERPGTSSAPKKPERRPVTSYVPRQPLTEKQRKQLLMENLLHDVDLKPQNNNILPKKKGIPYHTNERMNRHSASAKLNKMMQRKPSVAGSASAAAGQEVEVGGAAAATTEATVTVIG